MKTILKYTTLLAAVLLLSSACTKDPSAADQGGVSFALNFSGVTKAAATSPLDFCTIRIYSSEGLIRKYAYAELPEKLQLVAGTYTVKVSATQEGEMGDNPKATFTNKTFYGEETFTIEAQQTAAISVSCLVTNTTFQCNYDTKLSTFFDQGYYVYVSAIDQFDLTQISSSAVPTLKFEQTDNGKVGYFIVPDGVTSLSWHFHGEGTDIGTFDKEGVLTNVAAGTLYKVTFKYTPGTGLLVSSFSIVIDKTTTEVLDELWFTPEPEVKGSGFSIAQVQPYQAGTSLTYVVTGMYPLSQVDLSQGSSSYRLFGTGASLPAGITTTPVDERTLHVTLTDSYLSTLSSPGIQSLGFNVVDEHNGTISTASRIAIPGLIPLQQSDYNLWLNTAQFTGIVTSANATDVKVQLSTDQQNWSDLPATSGVDYTYTAQSADGIAADHTYYYRLMVGGSQSGQTLSLTTATGYQLPDSNFENWSTASDNSAMPCASGATAYWDSGNHGSQKMSKNITTQYTYPTGEAPSASAGNSAAKLQSQAVTFLGIGKFAAGNIFFGTYAGTDGMDGKIDFGHPVSINARPKTMTFWYKGTIGTIDRVDGSNSPVSTGQQDKTVMYVWLCNWTGTHRVFTGDQSTFVVPTQESTSEGPIIGYGVWENQSTTSSWTKITVPINYRDNYKTLTPNYIVVSCAASGYGDYFAGSTSTVAYIDEITFTY